MTDLHDDAVSQGHSFVSPPAFSVEVQISNQKNSREQVISTHSLIEQRSYICCRCFGCGCIRLNIQFDLLSAANIYC